MNYPGHLRGAWIAGLVSVGAGFFTGFVPLPDPTWQSMIHGDWYVTAFTLFVVAFGMALYPDVDTASIPSRKMVQMALGTLVLCYLFQRWNLMFVVALMALLPKAFGHRKWTHHLATPWVLAVVFILGNEWVNNNLSFFDVHVASRTMGMLSENLMVVFAAVLGHYIHLVLDSRICRFFVSGRWYR